MTVRRRYEEPPVRDALTELGKQATPTLAEFARYFVHCAPDDLARLAELDRAAGNAAPKGKPNGTTAREIARYLAELTPDECEQLAAQYVPPDLTTPKLITMPDGSVRKIF